MQVHVLGRQLPAVRSLLCLGVLLGALAFVAGPGADKASACGGLHCLPTSGYTLDHNWNCGVIDSNTRCFSSAHTWGWGSAAYNGAGSTWVCIYLGAYGSSCGTNLARACYWSGCNDQGDNTFPASVTNSGAPHTVLGHAKA